MLDGQDAYTLRRNASQKRRSGIERTAVDLVGRIDLRERAAHREVLEQDGVSRLVVPLLLRASVRLEIG